MTVTNISGREGDFQIDRNGFEIVALPPMPRDMTTDALIESHFYPEMEQVIKRQYVSLSMPPEEHSNPLLMSFSLFFLLLTSIALEPRLSFP